MILPQNIPRNAEGQYCINCFSTSVSRVFQNNLTYYYCNVCSQTLDRSLVIDNQTSWWLDDRDVYWHESVGVLVTHNNKLLTFLRQIYPFSHTIPAGHLDTGEYPQTAAIRELYEETGIKTDSLETLLENFDMPGDSCRRGSDHHRWHLFKLKLNEMPQIEVSDEAATKAHFMTYQELQSENNLTYPLQVFVKMFGEKICK